MHICLLIPVLDAFKGGNHLPLLAALKDVQFHIITNHSKPKNPVLPKNVTLETIPARLGPYYYGWSDSRFAKSVLRKYPAKHPFWKAFDIIHLNQSAGPAMLKLQDTGVPVCLLIHHPVTADLDVATQESGFFERMKWKLKYRKLVAWQKTACHEFDHILTVSETAERRIARDYKCGYDKIKIVPNGVDDSEFTPKNLSKTEYDVIAVGSFVHPRKGFPYLLDVYKKLSKKGMKIADVGRRSEAQQKALKGIRGLKQFGTVEQDQLVSMMQKSGALISTSLYEGFGLSLIEALACGRPCFAFDAGAVREVLEPIDPSLVVPLRDTDQLVQRITEFLELRMKERVERGEKYREKVIKLYPMKKAAKTLQDEYAKIIAHHQKHQ